VWRRRLGVSFRQERTHPNAPHLVMLSYAAWQRRFGGDVNVVGRGLVLSGDLYTVVGVLPARFEFGPVRGAELWTAIDPAHGCEARRSCHDLNGVGRLRPGGSAGAALREIKVIAGRLEKEYPDSNGGQSATVTPLANVITGPVRSLLILLMSGALLLLVLSVVNVNSLLLVRSESRRLEMAVRTSLGASRGRMVLQFLTEA
jgi:ABC-type antimicrobial peptide transport system permease subunit